MPLSLAVSSNRAGSFAGNRASTTTRSTQALRSAAAQLGVKAGPMFQPIRVAVCGRKNAPPLFETMVVLGHDVCLDRIRKAEANLQSLS